MSPKSSGTQPSRRIHRRTLGAAFQFITKNTTFAAKRSLTGNPLVSVAGDELFEHYRSGAFTTFSEQARQIIVRAIVGYAEALNEGHLALFDRHDPGGARFTKRMTDNISRAIDEFGLDGLLKLGDRELLPWLPSLPPFPETSSARNELDVILAAGGFNPLSFDWPAEMPKPSDRNVAKAVKWMFGQAPKVTLAATFPLTVCLEPTYRMREYLSGGKLSSETDLARTAVCRTASLLVRSVEKDTLYWIAPGCPRPTATSRADWARAFEAELRSQMLKAAENTGLDGLSDMLIWCGGSFDSDLKAWGIETTGLDYGPKPIQPVWDMDVGDYVFA